MSKTKILVFIVLIVLLIGAVFVFWWLDSGEKFVVEDLCGNGVCDEKEETLGICPEDCAESAFDSLPETDVLYLSTMVHLEGWKQEADKEFQFDGHVDAVWDFAEIFEANGALATFEASPEFVEGCANWDSDILNELYDAGHGVGVHADVGASVTDRDFFVTVLSRMKENLETVFQGEVRHASGVCSEYDWVKALADAGYEFTTGGVAYCLMSLPEEERPEEYRYCESPAECHDPYPSEQEDMIHPWRADSGDDWTGHDPDGDIVIFSSSGGLYAYDGNNDDFSVEDAELAIAELEEALSHVDPEKINVMYFSWSIGDADRHVEGAFNEFFEMLQPYIDSGLVEWKSIPDIYDIYLDWEASPAGVL